MTICRSSGSLVYLFFHLLTSLTIGTFVSCEKHIDSVSPNPQYSDSTNSANSSPHLNVLSSQDQFFTSSTTPLVITRSDASTFSSSDIKKSMSSTHNSSTVSSYSHTLSSSSIGGEPQGSSNLSSSSVSSESQSSSNLSSSAVPFNLNIPRTAFVHLFEWQWTDIAQECEDILAPVGYAAVQVSPPQKSIDGSPWWTRYQPLSYAIEGRSGSRDEFIDMVERCKAVGVDIYVDAVINHMAAGGRDFPDVPYTSSDFHGCASISDFTNRHEVQNCDLLGLNDLATEKEEVRNKIAAYLNDLISIGVAGFRIDAAKHMPASDLAAIQGKLTGTPYIFLEVIGASNEPIKPEEYIGIGAVTEFNFTQTMGHYFKRRASLYEILEIGSWDGWLASSNAVTFVANHDNQRQDTENTLTHKDGVGFNNTAHIFALGWPYGYPKVMSSFEWSDHDQGPPATGASTCYDGWLCEHRERPIRNMVGFRNYTASVPYTTNLWSNGSLAIAWGRGELGYVIINMEGFAIDLPLYTGMQTGTYCNIITGDFDPATKTCSGPTVSVDTRGHATVSVPSIGAVAIHVGAKVDDLCIIGHCDTDKIASHFTCNNGTTTDGQSVYVSGNIPELGNWEPAYAHKLEPSSYPTWTGSVDLPVNTDIEWKCIKRNQYNPAADKLWEPGDNTVFNTGTALVNTSGSF